MKGQPKPTPTTSTPPPVEAPAEPKLPMDYLPVIRSLAKEDPQFLVFYTSTLTNILVEKKILTAEDLDILFKIAVRNWEVAH